MRHDVLNVALSLPPFAPMVIVLDVVDPAMECHGSIESVQIKLNAYQEEQVDAP